MAPPCSIGEYLQLCGRPHKLKYVLMSVMLAWFMKDLSYRNV